MAVAYLAIFILGACSGAATALNGFIFVLFLIAGEADSAYIIGTIVLTALAELLRLAPSLPHNSFQYTVHFSRG